MPTTTLDTIRAALRKGGLNAAALFDFVSQAEKLAASAAERSRLAAAVLVDQPLASAADRAKHRDAAAAAHLEAEDATAVLAAAQRAHADAAAAEAEQSRTATYQAARTKAAAAEAALRKTYPALCRDMLALVRDLTEAQAAVNAANVMLPAGAAPIADPEVTARGVPAIGREVISDTEVERWCRLDEAKPVSDEAEALIYEAGEPGMGRRPGDEEPAFLRARFRRLEYRDAVLPIDCLPLASYLRLPAVFGDGCLFGHHVAFGFDPALSARLIGDDAPERVAARLADVNVTAPQGLDVYRPTRVTWEMLGYVGKTPMQDADPRFYHDKVVPMSAEPFAQHRSAAFGSR